jgi:outer membrane protein OmpA-like peptidoglycan-associated protein
MKKYILIFILTFLNVLNLFSQVDINKLKQLENEKNYYEAIKGYEQILLQDPYNKDALRNIIDLYININDYKSSLIYADKLVQIDSTSLSSLNTLADIYKKLCEYEKAINIYDKIIKLSNNNIIDKSVVNDAQKQKTILEKYVYELNNPSIQVNEFRELNSSNSEYGIYLYKDYLFVSKMISDKINYRTTQGYDNIYYVNLSTWNYDTTNFKKLDALNKPLATQGYISIDETNELIYFTRCEGTPSKCHIYYSKYTESPIYANKPQKLIIRDDKYNEGHAVISQNGTKMIFTADYPDSYGKRDLYMTTKINGKWTNPVNIGTNINTDGDEMFPYLYQDTILFFSSDSHNSIGGMDLFMSTFTNNEWSKPKQLKFPINSGADDFNIQFRDKLNEGLFCSNRPGGKGFDDIYSFTGIPWNIIYEGKVSSIDKKPLANAKIILYHDDVIDTFYTNEEAYFSINIDPNKSYNVIIQSEDYQDIIEVLNPDLFTQSFTTSIYYNYELKPVTKITEIKGKVLDKENTKPSINHKVSLISQNGYVDETQTDGNGFFTFTNVPINNKYNIIVTKDGYITQSKEIEPKTNQKTYDLIFEVERATYDKEYKIENIYYDYNKANLREESKKELDKLAQLLKLNPNLTVQINSYCDERGSDEYNLKLSYERAQAVVNYLISKGISPNKLIAKGWGKANPVVPNATTEEEHQLNRRTTFNIIHSDEISQHQVITSISPDIIEGFKGTGNMIYTIQIAALSKPATKMNAWNRIYRLDPNIKIFEVRGNDGLYRYYVGEFDNAQAAIEFKNKLANIGYSDCFVKIIEK